MPNPSPAAKIIAAVRNAPGNRVKVAVSDIDGVLRGKYLHKEKFYSAAESGFGFCDVVFGWDMMDVTLRQHDAHRLAQGLSRRRSRRSTSARYRTVPWDGGVPFFLGDFVAQKKRQGSAAADLPAAGAEARAEARREARLHRRCAAWNSSGSTSPRRRSPGPTRRAWGRRRSRRACSAIRCCAPTRTASSSRR